MQPVRKMSLRWHFRFSVDTSYWVIFFHIDGLVQEKRNPSALVMELRLSCINLSISLWNLSGRLGSPAKFQIQRLSSTIDFPRSNISWTLCDIDSRPWVCLPHEVSNCVVNYHISHINVPETRMTLYIYDQIKTVRPGNTFHITGPYFQGSNSHITISSHLFKWGVLYLETVFTTCTVRHAIRTFL